MQTFLDVVFTLYELRGQSLVLFPCDRADFIDKNSSNLQAPSSPPRRVPALWGQSVSQHKKVFEKLQDGNHMLAFSLPGLYAPLCTDHQLSLRSECLYAFCNPQQAPEGMLVFCKGCDTSHVQGNWERFPPTPQPMCEGRCLTRQSGYPPPPAPHTLPTLSLLIIR